MLTRYLSATLAALVLTSCAPSVPTIDPGTLSFQPGDTDRAQIPGSCRNLYDTTTINVGVVTFANNTTYGDMEVANITRDGTAVTTGVQGGVIGRTGRNSAGFLSAGVSRTNYSENIDVFMRQVSPALGEFAQTAAENIAVNMGGVNVYSRSRLQSILDEQQFQMTLADPNTVVEFGRLAGVQYMIAGSVDNIRSFYVPATDYQPQTLAEALIKGAIETQVGWNVNVELTVSLLDVQTGQVVLSEKVKGREVSGRQQRFSPESIIESAKKAMGEAMQDIKPRLSQHFALQGYVLQLKGGKKVALVNMGREQGLQPGQELQALEFYEISDPITNRTTCTTQTLPIKMVVSNQLAADNAWVAISTSNKPVLDRLRVGTLVRRSPLKGQSTINKLF